MLDWDVLCFESACINELAAMVTDDTTKTKRTEKTSRQ